MRVLVTGSHGYLGSVVAPFLTDAGHEVVGLDTFFYRGCDFGEDLASVPTVDRDVRDVTSDDLEGFEAVVHLAALSNDPVGDLDPSLTEQINHGATVQLARKARDAGVERFIFASSCSMYGASGADDTLDESAPLRPLTAYAESKVRSEEGLFALAQRDFVVTSMRNATVFGVSPRLRLDIVLNNLAAWCHTTGAIRLLSDGTAWRPMIHVRDIAKVTGAMLSAPSDTVRGEAFNVGADAQNYLVRELADSLAAITGCKVEMAQGSSPDNRSYRVDFSKLARTFPDLSLDWDINRGASELVDAYTRIGLSTDDFEGDRFVRLRRLRTLLDSGALAGDLRWSGAERAAPAAAAAARATFDGS